MKAKNLLVITATFVIIGLLTGCQRALPEPEIRYGEFPFRLEYEINGERFVIEDVLIAEFRYSIRGDMVMPRRRVWDTTFVNANSSLLIIAEIEDITISFFAGLAQYFMGDPDGGQYQRAERRLETGREYYIPGMPDISVRNPNNEQLVTRFRPEDAHEILAEFGITIISWEYTPAIVNSFRR